MKRFATGMLSFTGALIATLIHGIVLALVDGGLSILLPHIPVSGEIAIYAVALLMTIVSYGASAWVAHFFTCIYCIKLPRVNEEGIRLWLLFTVGIKLFTLFGQGLPLIPVALSAVLSYIVSHMFIWRRRANLDLNKPVAEPTQEEDVPADSFSSPDHLPSTLTRSVKVTKE